MIFCDLKFISQQQVSEAFETKNEYQFRYIFFGLKKDPNKPINLFGNLSTFEKVLKTPSSKKFIQICIDCGTNFYRVSFRNFLIVNNEKFNFTEKLKWNLPTSLCDRIIVCRKSKNLNDCCRYSQQ